MTNKLQDLLAKNTEKDPLSLRIKNVALHILQYYFLDGEDKKKILSVRAGTFQKNVDNAILEFIKDKPDAKFADLAETNPEFLERLTQIAKLKQIDESLSVMLEVAERDSIDRDNANAINDLMLDFEETGKFTVEAAEKLTLTLESIKSQHVGGSGGKKVAAVYGSASAPQIKDEVIATMEVWGNVAFDTAMAIKPGVVIISAKSGVGKTEKLFELHTMEVLRGRHSLYIYIEGTEETLRPRSNSMFTGIPRVVYDNGLLQTFAESAKVEDPFYTYYGGDITCENMREYQLIDIEFTVRCLSKEWQDKIISKFKETGDYLAAADMTLRAHIEGGQENPVALLYQEDDTLTMGSILDTIRQHKELYPDMEKVFFDQISNTEAAEGDSYETAKALRNEIKTAARYCENHDMLLFVAAQLTQKDTLEGSTSMLNGAQALLKIARAEDRTETVTALKTRGQIQGVQMVVEARPSNKTITDYSLATIRGSDGLPIGNIGVNSNEDI